MTRKLTDQQKIDMVEKYQNGMNGEELAKEYNVTRQAIHFLLKHRGISPNKTLSELRRKYYLNEYYFHKVDSERKAYFLGLLYADGCNCDDYAVTISLQEEDRFLIDTLKEELQSTRPLIFSKKKQEHHKNLIGVSLNSLILSNQLTELGCTPRKSLTLKFPTEDQVPKHLLRHFIRGYFDGDGYVGKTDCNAIIYNPIGCSVVSTLDFCNSLSEILKNELDVNTFIEKRFKDSDKSTRQLRICGNQQIYKFLSWIYEDCEIYMERKYLRYKSAESMMKVRNLI